MMNVWVQDHQAREELIWIYSTDCYELGHVFAMSRTCLCTTQGPAMLAKSLVVFLMARGRDNVSKAVDDRL